MTNPLFISSLSYRSNIGHPTLPFRMLDKLVLFAFLLVLILLAVIYYSKQLLTSFYLAGQLKNLLDNKIREQQQLLLELKRSNASTQCNIEHGTSTNRNRSSDGILTIHNPRVRTYTSRRSGNSRLGESNHLPQNRQRITGPQLRPSSNNGSIRNPRRHGRTNMRNANNHAEDCQFRSSSRPPRYSSVYPARDGSRHQQDTDEIPTPGNPLRNQPRNQGTDAGILFIMENIARESPIHDDNEQEDTGDGKALHESNSLINPS